MEGKLAGKCAVITGGGGGLGRATALAFAAEGAKVVVADPGTSRGGEGADKAPAQKVADEIKAKGGIAVPCFNSVSDFKQAEGIINTCVENFGRIDILVNLAGILRERMVWNLTEEDWDLVLSTHLKGTFNCSKFASGIMRKQRYGHIINVTSEAWLGVTGQANYSAAKGGITSFTKSIAKELGPSGVTANAISPLAATRLTMTEQVVFGLKKQLELGAITRAFYDAAMNMSGPEYVAPLIVYLASDKAANINGQVFFITRGKVAIYSDPVEAKTMFKTNDQGLWTVDDLEKFIPDSLLTGYVNPAPPQPPKEQK
jgi:NAD(P)-dependent dehydrogenase (short-subunit alcohol dehydrogenase family)